MILVLHHITANALEVIALFVPVSEDSNAELPFDDILCFVER